MRPVVSNLQAFRNSIKSAKGRLDGTVTDRYRKFVRQILKDLALQTPQWSGDLAASWQIVSGAGQVPLTLAATPFKVENFRSIEPKQKGDRAAVNYALQANEFVLKSLRYNSIVSIQNTNSTLNELTEEELRKVNRPTIPGDMLAIKQVAAKWSTKKIVLESDYVV